MYISVKVLGQKQYKATNQLMKLRVENISMWKSKNNFAQILHHTHNLKK